MIQLMKKYPGFSITETGNESKKNEAHPMQKGVGPVLFPRNLEISEKCCRGSCRPGMLDHKRTL